MSTFPVTRLRRFRRTAALRLARARDAALARRLRLPALRLPGRGGRARRSRACPASRSARSTSSATRPRTRTSLGVSAVLLFGIPEEKDEAASGAYDEDGIVQRALRALREQVPELVLLTDVCLCEYTSHGHCGLVEGDEVLNDVSLELLARDGRQPRRGRRRRRLPERHDRRPRGRDPRRARRRRLRARPDPRLLGEVRLGLLRAVPRGGRVDARRSATGAATRWTRPTSARRCASASSTSPRAPTRSWSSRRFPTST